MKKGFTLIELLVVVLIIGILSAVALPQYQKAVEKARLAKYMPIVRALYDAEQRYYLANGKYTAELTMLDIEVPAGGCTYYFEPSKDRNSSYWECSDPFERYGTWGLNNVQAGDDKIRYVMYFEDATKNDIEFKKGDIVCYSKGSIADGVCRSLGKGTQYPGASEDAWTYYILD